MNSVVSLFIWNNAAYKTLYYISWLVCTHPSKHVAGWPNEQQAMRPSARELEVQVLCFAISSHRVGRSAAAQCDNYLSAGGGWSPASMPLLYTLQQKKSVACRLHLSLWLWLSAGSIIKQQRLGDGERMLVGFDPLASSQVLRVKVIPGWAGEFYLKDGRR